VSLATTGDLVSSAAARGGAVAAFNVITLEHAEAIVEAAERTALPVVLQVSENAVRYHRKAVHPVAAACRAMAEASGAPVALHLDHVEDLELLQRAADAGFSSVMVDCGRLPHDENTATTARATSWAHGAGLWVEAELGYVGGKAGAPQSAHAPGVRTDPDEAAEFVAATRVDALAVAVGSSHAMTTRSATLDHDLVRRLATALPVPLVLHGSSGVPDDELRAAVAAGMRKVNIGTALNLALTAAVREALTAEPDLVDPRTYLRRGRAAMADCAAELLTVVAG
jgi:fructose-bisphosphate aldolase class II